MIQEEKKEYILNKLNKFKILKIKELSRDLDCTDAAIRYIVNDLAKNKLLRRVHGGVAKGEKTVADISVSLLKTKNIEEKKQIAEIALNFIEENSTIILDSGTTNCVFAEKINGFKNLNVITNSIKIANILYRKPDVNIIVLGGIIRRLTDSIVNYSNESPVKTLKANKLFLNVGAITINEGLTDPCYQEAMIKRDMIGIASEIIVLADSTKIGKVAISSICSFTRINKFITDTSVSKDFVNQVNELGIEIFYD